MADKIVKLVDKNSNNLYPVAGAVIDNAVSTGAISSQAVTNAKIENGAVNGVANNATAIGTAKLALDTVGTPNLRDASVTSSKIDWTTIDYSQERIIGKFNGKLLYEKVFTNNITVPARPSANHNYGRVEVSFDISPTFVLKIENLFRSSDGWSGQLPILGDSIGGSPDDIVARLSHWVLNSSNRMAIFSSLNTTITGTLYTTITYTKD